MTKEAISDAIKAYTDILTDSTALTQYFEQGNSFIYHKQDCAASSANLHVYPAIDGEDLVFLVIPAEYDNAIYADDIQKYVERCSVSWRSPNGGEWEIMPEVAIHRMNEWNNNYQNWIGKQPNEPFGMFQAFKISTDDFQEETVHVNMGLRLVKEPLPHHLADLIVCNQSVKTLTYDDFARPVPPYGGASASSSSFFLLSL